MTDDRYGKIHTDGSRSGGQPVVATQKAHTAMLEVLAEWGIEPRSATPRQLTVATTEALCCAIEQHEDFKQEVSDAVEKAIGHIKDGRSASAAGAIGAFVIRKPKPEPDPLVDVFDECFNQNVLEGETWSEAMARKTRAALEARGLEIREKVQ